MCLLNLMADVPANVHPGEIRGNGERVVLDMRLVGDEGAASWTEVVRDW